MKIICEKCGEFKDNEAKGMCSKCYQRTKREGKTIEEKNEWNHRSGRTQSMIDNKACSSHLGFYLANNIMRELYPDAEEMPYGNSGFTHILHGKYYQVVTSTPKQVGNKSPWFGFHTRQNTICDYFIFLAFRDRESTIPTQIWKVPNFGDIQDKKLTSISLSRLSKWDCFLI